MPLEKFLLNRRTVFIVLPSFPRSSLSASESSLAQAPSFIPQGRVHCSHRCSHTYCSRQNISSPYIIIIFIIIIIKPSYILIHVKCLIPIILKQIRKIQTCNIPINIWSRTLDSGRNLLLHSNITDKCSGIIPATSQINAPE